MGKVNGGSGFGGDGCSDIGRIGDKIWGNVGGCGIEGTNGNIKLN